MNYREFKKNYKKNRNKFKNFECIPNELRDILFNLFGQGTVKVYPIDNECYLFEYLCKEFRVHIDLYDGYYLIQVDLKECFNKKSKSPLKFIFDPEIPPLKSMPSRIKEAVDFMLSKRDLVRKYSWSLPEFDDLDIAYTHYKR